MKKIPLDKYPKDKTKSLLSGIPFFSDLAIKDSQQHQLLLHHSVIVELSGGDVLIKKGDTDRTFYFLLKGDLAVYAEEKLDRKSTAIGTLSQGQVLGALTIITGLPRTATVAVEKKAGDAMVFETDFSVFGALEDFSKITLATKLAFFRLVINNTRFKLETYKAKNAKHPLAEVYAKLQKFAGAKDTKEELIFHAKQATTLARLLQKWNEVQ